MITAHAQHDDVNHWLAPLRYSIHPHFVSFWWSSGKGAHFPGTWYSGRWSESIDALSAVAISTGVWTEIRDHFSRESMRSLKGNTSEWPSGVAGRFTAFGAILDQAEGRGWVDMLNIVRPLFYDHLWPHDIMVSVPQLPGSLCELGPLGSMPELDWDDYSGCKVSKYSDVQAN